MAKRKEHHVVPNPVGGWDVKRENAGRASKHFDKKVDAITWARGVSKRHGTELIPHRKDGIIHKPDSHGNDPIPPRDKK